MNAEFQAAIERAACREKSGIGTLSEKSLHSSLKYYFEPEESRHEVKIAGYFADIVGENGIIEIQTGNFQSIRQKLMEFLAVTGVTLVHPVIRERRIITLDPNTGLVKSNRKSPKRGTLYSAFPELYKIKNLLAKPSLTLCLTLVDITEYRTALVNGRSRKERIKSKVDKIPTELLEEIYFFSKEDYRLFLPNELPEEFTCGEFSALALISAELGSIVLNVLTHLEITEKKGRRERKQLWGVKPTEVYE